MRPLKKVAASKSSAILSYQPTMADMLKKKQKWLPDSPQSKELDRKVLEMIAMRNYPFSIVHEGGFLCLVQYLNAQVNLKSHKLYRDKLHSTYDAVVRKVMDLISTAEHLSFTTDIWTNKAKTESLISLTAHYIDFVSKTTPKIILAAKHMECYRSALARKIAGHFARSEQARRRLKEIQQHHGFRILQTVQSVPTRWNSVNSMLERLLEQKDALALYEARYDMPASLSANHWKIAESV
ncbi:hypothetical protein JTE90_026939 [Oedothorax gibbosus]|uniref:Zinc finger BED domain-containing protein 4 n=1 Tax=Oedothorax gibbosus TaxID=931172 RepID=A0AAV6TW97_9ARAC|nr:hypothetical protein JTE90_026939 [Oedothorax gibbosus]